MKRCLELTEITTGEGRNERVQLLHESTGIQVDCPYHPSRHESFKMGVKMLTLLIDERQLMLNREPKKRRRKQ